MATLNESIQRPSRRGAGLDFSIVGTVLQNPNEFFDQVKNGIELPNKIMTLLLSSIVFLTIYGAIIGSGHPLQAVSTAVKFPLVFIGGLVACVPALFIFDVLLGSRRSLAQTVTVLLTTVTIISLLLFSFAPITIVFKLTANGFQFFKLLNVGFLLIAIMVGLFYIEWGLTRTANGEKNSMIRHIFYGIWIVVFVLVISQMAWSLRPFFHYPGSAFILFVGESNVFTESFMALGELLGFWIVR